MTEINTLFKGSLRPRTGYKGGGDPLERWKSNMTNLAMRHRAEAKAGRQADKKPWHEQQPDGSYQATIRLNHALVEIDGQNCWELGSLDDVVKFYDFVIENLKAGAFDQAIVNTAINIKSMRRDALSAMERRFPDSAQVGEMTESDKEPASANHAQ
jgi:hypothetical protein